MTTTEATQAIRQMIGPMIFGATFTTLDGRTRTGAFILRPSDNLPYDADAQGNLLVRDMNVRADGDPGVRTIRLESVTSLRVRGREVAR